jgi:hypothetical protein
MEKIKAEVNKGEGTITLVDLLPRMKQIWLTLISIERKESERTYTSYRKRN